MTHNCEKEMQENIGRQRRQTLGKIQFKRS